MVPLQLGGLESWQPVGQDLPQAGLLLSHSRAVAQQPGCYSSAKVEDLAVGVVMTAARPEPFGEAVGSQRLYTFGVHRGNLLNHILIGGA
jgi:hypothetical protein